MLVQHGSNNVDRVAPREESEVILRGASTRPSMLDFDNRNEARTRTDLIDPRLRDEKWDVVDQTSTGLGDDDEERLHYFSGLLRRLWEVRGPS